MKHCDFNLSRLQNANFSDSQASGAKFTDANLANASFTSAMLDSCSFKGSVLPGVTFSQCDLDKVHDLAGCILWEADFSDARGKLRGGGSLAGTTEGGWRLLHPEHSYTGQKDKRGSSNLRGARLEGLNLKKAVWAGVDLRSTIEDRDHPSSTHPIYVDPREYKKLQAKAGRSGPVQRLFPLEYSFKEQRTSFERSDLTGSDFSGAKLDDVSFHQAVLNKVNFQKASLIADDRGRLAQFRRANVEGADFVEAKIGAKEESSRIFKDALNLDKATWDPDCRP